MKNIFSIFLLVTVTPAISQKDTILDLDSYFTSIIVHDLEVSINWYSDILGLEMVNKNESEDLGFKLANLKRGNIFVELIELEKALSPEDFISNYNPGVRIKGFFKTGFLVSDFEKWIDHFNKKGVLFHGNAVRDELTEKKMVIILDPDGNYIQIFEK